MGDEERDRARAIGLILSPFPLAAMVMILSGPRRALNSPVFAVTSVAGLLALGRRGVALLDGPRGWMERNSPLVVALVALIFGALSIGNGVEGPAG